MKGPSGRSLVSVESLLRTVLREFYILGFGVCGFRVSDFRCNQVELFVAFQTT